MDLDLSELEVRILGCLIEKEQTTPDYYPLSLNSLNNACNQKSNRSPVTSYDESTTLDGVKRLQSRGLVVISSGAGQRVRKYHHRFPEKYFVSRPEMILLCGLMLRGPQTAGELRTRSDRMYHFQDLDEVGEALNELMNEREQALVVRLPRQPGRKEHRYMHLLSGEPELSVEEPPSAESRETVSADDGRIKELEQEVVSLRSELENLKQEFDSFKKQFE